MDVKLNYNLPLVLNPVKISIGVHIILFYPISSINFAVARRQLGCLI